jgi:hypothetical protein
MVEMFICCVQPDDIACLVDERQSALRKLKVNPHDKEALETVQKVQQQVSYDLNFRFHFATMKLDTGVVPFVSISWSSAVINVFLLLLSPALL